LIFFIEEGSGSVKNENQDPDPSKMSRIRNPATISTTFLTNTMTTIATTIKKSQVEKEKSMFIATKVSLNQPAINHLPETCPRVSR